MTLAGKQILITGATGFLGGALARRLLQDGAKVRILARSPDKATSLRERGAEIVQGDLTNADSLRGVTDGCEIVFHAAVDYTTYERQQAINVEATRHLIDEAIRTRTTRFVHVSTVGVYGAHVRGDVAEDRPTHPLADKYAITKAQAERIVIEAGQRNRLSTVIIRPSMIYGAGADIWTNGLFRLVHRRPHLWIDDGGGSAPLIHVDDVVDCIVTAADHPAAHGETFNCAPDPTPTWREVMSAYARLARFGRWQPIPLVPVLVPVAGMAMLFSPRGSIARDFPELIGFMREPVSYKMTKARDVLGWSPRVNLETGIISCLPALRQTFDLR